VPPTTRRLAAGPCTVAASPLANREWWAAKLAGNVARDRRADAVLRAEGWRVLRFWEHEDPDAVADAICRALGRPSDEE
jgi:DNA mismatch endonuclease, patch repair protein